MIIEELKYWLALWRISTIGPTRFAKLLQFFPSLKELFAQSDKALLQLGLDEILIAAIKNPDWSAVENDLRWGQTNNHHIITWQDETYPPLLKEIHSSPPLLFIAGNLPVITQPQLAIVGSRNPTPIGMETAYQFAQTLARQGLTITSGLAIGIDSAAHRGALSQKLYTIAVCGCGLESIYPLSNRQLAEEIMEKGALVSEFPLGVEAQAKNFPRRNRVVSGLSLGTLVVEATLRSGSLITARLANEQGREVFAIPGSIHNPQARGCHFLLKQGAKLVETATDIIEEFPSLHQAVASSYAQEIENLLDEDQRKLLECIGYEVTTMDSILLRSGLPTGKVTTILLMLELQKIIASIPGGYIRIKNYE